MGRETISTIDIRAAQCQIDDIPRFLGWLQEIGQRCGTHIICFNADLLAGRRHADAAMQHAIRAFDANDTISNTLEMEALLYAAGSRQCSVATSFGLHIGENHLWVCCYPLVDDVWECLSPMLHCIDAGAWSSVDEKKSAVLMQFFGIARDELGAAGGQDRITDLVLERVALLQVVR